MKTKLMKTVQIGIVLVAVITFFLQPMQMVFAKENLPQGQCECVTYVVFTEFGKRLTEASEGQWDEAKDLVDPDFWSAAHMRENNLDVSLARSRTATAKRGDVIIFQSDAVYKVLVTDGQNKQWKEQTSAGYGHGHIGIILAADYSEKDQGWNITMESANWPENWGPFITSDEGFPQFLDPANNKSFECKYVSKNQHIFVPNGDKISFWRMGK